MSSGQRLCHISGTHSWWDRYRFPYVLLAELKFNSLFTILLLTIYCGLPSCESVAAAALARAVRGLLKVVSIPALESYWSSSFPMISVSHDSLAAIEVLFPR